VPKKQKTKKQNRENLTTMFVPVTNFWQLLVCKQPPLPSGQKSIFSRFFPEGRGWLFTGWQLPSFCFCIFDNLRKNLKLITLKLGMLALQITD